MMVLTFTPVVVTRVPKVLKESWSRSEFSIITIATLVAPEARVPSPVTFPHSGLALVEDGDEDERRGRVEKENWE